MSALKANGSSPTLNFRLNLTPTERSTLDVIALNYGMSKSAYITACLENGSRRLRRVTRQEVYDQADLRSLLTVRLSEGLLAKCKAESSKLGFTNFSEYVRQKVASGPGPTVRPPPRSGYGHRGRPSRGERLRAMAAARGLGELQTMLLEVDGLRSFVTGIYELLLKAGVRPGDREAVFELAKRLVGFEVRNVPQAGDVQGRRELVFSAWSPRHGFVEIEPSPPEALAQIKSILKR